MKAILYLKHDHGLLEEPVEMSFSMTNTIKANKYKCEILMRDNSNLTQ